jgi:hypothetical protein
MVCFSKEECDKIINLTLEIEGTHRDGNSKNVERPSEKISYTYYNIYKDKNVDWIFDRITDYLVLDNDIEIIKPFDIIHLHKYEEGNQFKRHRDIYYPNQILNVGVCLNDDYVGGDFVLYGPTQIIPKIAGTIYSFKNTREHEVTKIESGIRYSLIIFLYKENMKSSVSLI